MRLRVRIDRLVVDGLPPGPLSPAAVAAAVEAELGALLAADLPPPLRSDGTLAVLRVGGPDFPPSTPAGLGRGIAAAVHRGLGGLDG